MTIRQECWRAHNVCSGQSLLLLFIHSLTQNPHSISHQPGASHLLQPSSALLEPCYSYRMHATSESHTSLGRSKRGCPSTYRMAAGYLWASLYQIEKCLPVNTRCELGDYYSCSSPFSTVSETASDFPNNLEECSLRLDRIFAASKLCTMVYHLLNLKIPKQIATRCPNSSGSYLISSIKNHVYRSFCSTVSLVICTSLPHISLIV